MAFTSGFFFILAQLLARGFNFIVTPIYSRLLNQKLKDVYIKAHPRA